MPTHLDVEVLPPEFDAHGRDLVICRGSPERHIQFKTQAEGNVTVSLSLAKKPSGCVIRVGIGELLNLGFIGGLADLQDSLCLQSTIFQIARRMTRNKEGQQPPRANFRVVPRQEFTKITTIDEVVPRVFGELPSSKTS
ncbi:MAG TPA: hypothetical protein VKX49_07015 [Bryobacteraceae bacterium]|nr:hypothetical protein [Bryobacteraceae bacterium]